MGGEAQQGAIEFYNLTALVEGVDQGLNLRFGEGGFFDEVDADFVDDLGADNDAGGVDEGGGDRLFAGVLVVGEGVDPDVGVEEVGFRGCGHRFRRG